MMRCNKGVWWSPHFRRPSHQPEKPQEVEALLDKPELSNSEECLGLRDPAARSPSNGDREPPKATGAVLTPTTPHASLRMPSEHRRNRRPVIDDGLSSLSGARVGGRISRYVQERLQCHGSHAGTKGGGLSHQLITERLMKVSLRSPRPAPAQKPSRKAPMPTRLTQGPELLVPCSCCCYCRL